MQAAPLPDFRLEVYLGRWEFSARHHLTASDAETLTVREVLGDDGLEQLARLSHGYTPTWGSDELREAIAATYENGLPRTCWCSRAAVSGLSLDPESRWEELFEWERPQAGCVCFPRYLGPDGVEEELCRALVEQAGVVLLPASIYRSELGPVPPDRFRIGVGRADPAPALEAFDVFPGARAPAPGR